MTTPLEQLALYLGQRLDLMEARIMATVAELQQNLDTLTASVADYTSDVSSTLAEIKTTLDAALANDATDAATITDLRAQLAALQSGVDSALAKTTALNQAIAAADVAVDQPVVPETE